MKRALFRLAWACVCIRMCQTSGRAADIRRSGCVEKLFVSHQASQSQTHMKKLVYAADVNKQVTNVLVALLVVIALAQVIPASSACMLVYVMETQRLVPLPPPDLPLLPRCCPQPRTNPQGLFLQTTWRSPYIARASSSSPAWSASWWCAA